MNNSEISNDFMVVTSTFVINDGMPVLEVSHEDDEEGGSLWQFHCGNSDYDLQKMMLVRFDTILALDFSLKEVANLPKGKVMVREAQTLPWRLTK